MDKKVWLDYLYYEMGKQATDFRLASTYKDKNGDEKISKWHNYLDVQGNDKLISEVNQRELLKNEIILDLDNGNYEDYLSLISRLRKDGFKFYAYSTDEQRARHIHFFYDMKLALLEKKEREELREYLISRYGCDSQLKIDSHLIPIENTAHWKTGKIKEVIDKEEGINITEPLLEEFRLNKLRIERERKLKPFILDESNLPPLIDHAVGSVNINGVTYRYYGTKIHQEIITKDNSLTNKKVDALVFENGEIISEHSESSDFKFVFDSVMTLKRNRWSLSSINSFCRRLYNSDDITFKNVYSEFKKFYDNSMVFEFPQWYSLCVLWDMCTYYWDMLDKFLMIKHGGITGSAKSKGMKVSANLSFNGKKFLCPTPANFFRYRHNNKATLYIEEAERLFDDTKKKNVGDSELVEYLNGSYEKGNTVPRQNDVNIKQTDEFDPAGFTRIGSINPLKGALEKRSIPLNMIIAPSKDIRGNVEIPTETDVEYSKARDLAYINGLQNYRQFKDALETVENNYNLQNRQWILAKPIIAMAHCVDLELEKEVGNFIAKLFDIRDDKLDENSWDMILSKVLIDLYCRAKTDTFIPTDRLKERFIELLNSTGNNQYKVSNTKIGILMRELGFTDYKANPTGNQRGYRLGFFKLCEILIRQNNANLASIKNKVSEVSECKYSDDEINKWHSDTFQTPDTLDKESSDTLTVMTPVSDADCKSKEINAQNVLADIIRLDEGIGANTKILLEYYSDSVKLMRVLEYLRSRGEIFNPKPDYWKALR